MHPKIFSITLAASISLSASYADEVTYSEPRRVARKIANLPSKVSSEVSTHNISTAEASGTGFSVFVGAGGGYLSTSPVGTSIEPSRAGAMMQGRLGLSFHNPSLAIDLTGGWIQSRIDGVATSTSGNSRSETESVVMTRAASLDFSPRYRLGNYELGPVGGVLLGTNATFDESKEGATAPIFLGLRAAAMFEAKDFLFRVSLQGSTSVAIPDRSAFMTIAALEIGIPIVQGKTVVREKRINTVRDNFQRETFEIEKVVTKEVVKEIVTFSFDDQIVHFEFDRAELKSESADFIRQLGDYLAANASQWGRVTIEGHTDQRGTDEYNQKLSESRVATVREQLVSAGLDADRVETRAHGSSRPIDRGLADISHARNRRVEMSFTDVTDAKELRDAINRIRFATAKPSTCTGDHCQ